MYCPKCGSEIEGGKFCPKCGTALESEIMPAPTAERTERAGREHSIEEFVKRTKQKSQSGETFQLENPYLVDINVRGRIWAKVGAMVAYTGNVKFRRESSLEHGLDKFVKKAITGEGTKLMKVKGEGHVYLADKGKQITILDLQDDKIYVNGNDVLAFEDGIDWDITMMTSGSSMMAGGLFNIKLQGRGMIAITTHYTPITLEVTPDRPVMTDPNATVAWSGGLNPTLKTDIDFGTLIGRDSGETFQMKFQGQGFVIVQPYEEGTQKA